MKPLVLHDIQVGLAPYVLGSAMPNRVGIWTWGCSLPVCRGCTSLNTHQRRDNAHEFSVASLINLLRVKGRNGLTITGGEPSDQADVLQPLLVDFKSQFPDAELVLYTGLRWSVFQAKFPTLADISDLVVAGPYVQSLPATTALAGSSNQEIKLLTPLATKLFAGYEQWPKNRVQVSKTISSNELTLVGIPNTAAIQKTTRTMTSTIEYASWQPIDLKE